jgi:hypothetical protein
MSESKIQNSFTDAEQQAQQVQLEANNAHIEKYAAKQKENRLLGAQLQCLLVEKKSVADENRRLTEQCQGIEQERERVSKLEVVNNNLMIEGRELKDQAVTCTRLLADLDNTINSTKASHSWELQDLKNKQDSALKVLEEKHAHSKKAFSEGLVLYNQMTENLIEISN